MTDKANNAPVAQDENKLIAERRVKLEKIRSNCSANGFPNDFKREHLAADIQAEHGEKTKEELEQLQLTYAIAGRIMAKRGPFLVIQDSSGRIQGYAEKTVQKEIVVAYTQNNTTVFVNRFNSIPFFKSLLAVDDDMSLNVFI